MNVWSDSGGSILIIPVSTFSQGRNLSEYYTLSPVFPLDLPQFHHIIFDHCTLASHLHNPLRLSKYSIAQGKSITMAKESKKKTAEKVVTKTATKEIAAKKDAVVKKVPVKKVAAKKAAVKAAAPVKAEPVKTAPVKAAPVKKASAQKAPKALTTIVVKIDVGFGNSLSLRGEGPALSWETGVVMGCADANEWIWSSDAVKGSLEFKVLINDEEWATGPNCVVAAGQRIEITPSF